VILSTRTRLVDELVHAPTSNAHIKSPEELRGKRLFLRVRIAKRSHGIATASTW